MPLCKHALERKISLPGEDYAAANSANYLRKRLILATFQTVIVMKHKFKGIVGIGEKETEYMLLSSDNCQETRIGK